MIQRMLVHSGKLLLIISLLKKEDEYAIIRGENVLARNKLI